MGQFASSEEATARMRELMRKYPTAFAACRAMVWHRLVKGACCFLFHIACTLCTPMAIFGLLRWVQSDDAPAGEGIGFVVALAAAAVLGFLAEHQFEHEATRAGIDCRSGMAGLLYEKVLRLTLYDSASTHSGEISNLFSVDAPSLKSLWEGALTLLLQPLEIIAIVGLLYTFVQEAAFGGIAVVLGALLVSHAAGGRVEALEKQRASLADVRARDTLEMLQGMRVVKTNSWEPQFAALIEATRAQESRLTRRAGWYLAVINVCSSNSVDLISVAIVAIYTAAMGQPLDPSILFSFWVLLGLLHGRIFHFPVALSQVKEGRGALARLERFLARSEHKDTRHIEASSASLAEFSKGDAGVAVAIRDGTFSWQPPQQHQSPMQQQQPPHEGKGDDHDPAAPVAILQDVNLTVRSGECVAVVGAVGQGKTSLLCALLGELACLQGRVSLAVGPPPAAAAQASAAASNHNQWSGIAIVPQTAWIVAGSIRDNILFGRPYDAAWYSSVLSACCLAADLTAFPAGDASNVATTTLSGGQRQRISLARAVYGRAAVYVLDDFVSALDAKVTAAITRDVLHGLLQHTTRIVVTNTGSVLASCDSVAALVPISVVKGGSTAAAAAQHEAGPAAASSSPSSSQSSGGPFTVLQGSRDAMLQHPALASLMHHMTAHPTVSVDEVMLEAAAAGDDTAPATTAATAATAAATAAAVPVKGAGSGSGATVEEVEADAEEAQAEDAVAALTSKPAPAASAANSGNKRADVAELGEVSPAMPLLSSWALGAGGWWWALFTLSWLFIEAAAVEIGVYLLAWWSDDLSFQRYSYTTYFVAYGIAVIVEFAAAYARQLCYSVGVTSSADALHSSLLFRVTHAPQSFFDTHTPSRILQWFTRDMDHLDSATFYASEYFWLGLVYGTTVVVTQATVSPWLIIPFSITCALIYAVIKQEDVGRQKALAYLATHGNDALTAPAEANGEQPAKPLPAQASGRTGAASSSIVSSSNSKVQSAAPPPLPSMPVSVLQELEAAATAPLVSHFGATLEGLVSLRVMSGSAGAGGAGSRSGGAVGRHRFLSRYHSLMDAHSAALARVTAAQHKQVLVANMLGALYYITSTLLIVPVRVLEGNGAGSSTGDAARGMTAGEAGFIVVNSCFSSYMSHMVIQQRAALSSLALTRGALLRTVTTLQQEPSVAPGAADADRSAQIAARYARYAAKLPKPASASAAAAVPPRSPVRASVGVVVVAQGSSLPPPVPPPGGWPSRGRITFENVRMRYRPDAPLVLDGVSLDVTPGLHVGVVGRTGSGKSSMLAALTRLVELPRSGDALPPGCSPIHGGRILIDGVDIATLPLSVVRAAVSVISQDPLFFSGSLRRNLDPFTEYSDVQLLTALKRVGLLHFAASHARTTSGSSNNTSVTVTPAHSAHHSKQATTATAGTADSEHGHDDNDHEQLTAAEAADTSPLDMTIAEKGGNLSIGQQQLLAMARAILRQPRILCMDEASASLDAATEAVLNRTVRRLFRGATVLTIAHRLVSVIDSHRVLVLQSGRVAEWAHPHDLLCTPPQPTTTAAAVGGGAGSFAGMVAALPPAAQDRLRARAAAAHAQHTVEGVA